MKGVVVCPEPLAALAGAHVLRLGGSAVDAAIATAFAQTVVSPAMTTLAGNGIMNVFHAPTGRHQLVDFMGYAGARATAEMYERAPAGAQHRGYASVLVPTLVRGLAHRLRRLRERAPPVAGTARAGHPLRRGRVPRVPVHASVLAGREPGPADRRPLRRPRDAHDDRGLRRHLHSRRARPRHRRPDRPARSGPDAPDPRRRGRRRLLHRGHRPAARPRPGVPRRSGHRPRSGRVPVLRRRAPPRHLSRADGLDRPRPPHRDPAGRAPPRARRLRPGGARGGLGRLLRADGPGARPGVSRPGALHGRPHRRGPARDDGGPAVRRRAARPHRRGAGGRSPARDHAGLHAGCRRLGRLLHPLGGHRLRRGHAGARIHAQQQHDGLRPAPGPRQLDRPGEAPHLRRRADPRARQRPGPLRPRLAARRPEDQRDGPRPRRAGGLRALAGRRGREPAHSLRGRPRRRAHRAVLPASRPTCAGRSRRGDSACARITTAGASV